MKRILLSLLALLSIGAVVARADDKKAADDKKPADEVAVIKTTDGDIVMGFWPDVAPNTVANFKQLAKSGFYDGTVFHRIMKGFMVQGGDPLSKDPAQQDRWGTGGSGHNIKAEFSDKKHERGVISMARSMDPDSASSQFFICLGAADSPQMQFLNGKYAAFGKLINGDDVLSKIADTPVTTGPSGEPSKPTETVKIISVKIVPAGSVK